MTAASSGEDSFLATKCMDFCNALASQGKGFKFSLTIGSTFTFSLETRGGKDTLPARTKKSPSALRRNAKRRQEFLMKKSLPAVVESSQEASEENFEFKCDHCDTGFKTRNGLNIHVGRTHKKSAKTPEKSRESSSTLPLNTSPLPLSNREEICNNCEGPFSPSHQCENGGIEVEEPEEPSVVGVEQGLGGGDEDHWTIDPDPTNVDKCTIYCFKNCERLCECDCPSCNAD